MKTQLKMINGDLLQYHINMTQLLRIKNSKPICLDRVILQQPQNILILIHQQQDLQMVTIEFLVHMVLNLILLNLVLIDKIKNILGKYIC